MSYTNAEHLPSLAHPLILSPARRIKNRKGIHLPPFPAINLSWDGFTISRLHWAVINVTSPERREVFIKLANFHEDRHVDLSSTPYSLFTKHRFIDLYHMVMKTFGQKEELIDVPVTANESGNDLQRKLLDVDLFVSGSTCIEEVYAIRTSLLQAQNEKIIKPADAEKIITAYKKAYEYIPGFESAYNAFDFVAGKIGEAAATGLVHSVLSTLLPRHAFAAILCSFSSRPSTGFIWNVSKKDTSHLNNLSVQEAYDFFNSYIHDMDPDDSRYGRAKFLNHVVKVEQVTIDSRTTEDMKDDLLKLLFGGSPNSLLSQYYFENGGFKLEFPVEVDHPHFVIFLEAIVQQLVTGIGLLCPFYSWSPGRCCGNCSNRVLLEKVWKCTAHNSSKCRLWRRPICLDQ
jgi:hypothetical protein